MWARFVWLGRISIMPPDSSRLVSHENIIVGNTVLYGATSGECYFSGVAVSVLQCAFRAIAVVEGLASRLRVHDGWHGCGAGTKRAQFARACLAA